jgi:hypothetical protein
LIALSIGMNAAALGLLRLAWGRKQGGVVLLLAWLCFASAILIWAIARGESGVAESVVLFSVLAAAYVGFLFLRAPRAEGVSNAARPTREPSTFGRRAALLILAALATTIGVLALNAVWFTLTSAMRWAPADAIVSTVLLATVAWPLLFCWLLMEQSAPRRLLAMAGLVALGVGALVLA